MRKASAAPVPNSAEFPHRGRLMGIDYGEKRVGLALSNFEQTLATPLETIERRDEKQDAKHLQKVATEYMVVALVVGLPVHMSGDEGAKAREARKYGDWVARVTKLPVRYHDERYSSALADELLEQLDLNPKQRKARRDRIAAQILLQSYLDSSRLDQPPGAL